MNWIIYYNHKPKYNNKVHLWGGISRKGLTNLVIFEGKMNSAGFQNILTEGLLPFLIQFTFFNTIFILNIKF